jgi:gluconate kinase
MSEVVLDPNWDNTGVLIECSALKKRKQEELEKYSAYA